MVFPVRYGEDNLAWLVSDKDGTTAVVDPGDAAAVLDALAARELRPAAILCTHHHADHTAGVTALRRALPGIAIHAHVRTASRLGNTAREHDDGDAIRCGNLEFVCLSTPGHTRDSLCYRLGDSHLFSGDTLFAAGCGRLFEGTARTMQASLDRLARLPPAILVCPGHDYLTDNLAFAEQFAHDAEAFARRRRDLAEGTEPPASLATELRTNPFLRTADPDLITSLAVRAGRDAFDATDPAGVLACLRRLRNDWH